MQYKDLAIAALFWIAFVWMMKKKESVREDIYFLVSALFMGAAASFAAMFFQQRFRYGFTLVFFVCLVIPIAIIFAMIINSVRKHQRSGELPQTETSP